MINFSELERAREDHRTRIFSSSIPEQPTIQPQYGVLFDQILKETSDDKTFHINPESLIELGNVLSAKLNRPPHRGSRETLTPHDQLYIYLLWLSTPSSQKFLSGIIGITSSLLSRVVDRIRPILLSYALQMFESAPRPDINPEYELPFVGLLVDATSVTISTPALPFAERKAYYDGHHSCYSMKIEVAVNPRPPYQALFISDVVPGAVHDVALFRKGYERYKHYLKKHHMNKRFFQMI